VIGTGSREAQTFCEMCPLLPSGRVSLDCKNVDQILGRGKQRKENQRKGCNPFGIMPKDREKAEKAFLFGGLLSPCSRVFRVWKSSGLWSDFSEKTVISKSHKLRH